MPKYINMTPKHQATDMAGDYHYFAVTGVGWSTDSDMATAIRKRMDDDRGYNVDSCSLYKVPGSNDSRYDISFFQPQVEGVQYLGDFNYDNFKGKKT